MVADRRIRQVVRLESDVPGVSSLAKDLRADFRTTGEVDLRGVSRRQIVVAEQRAANGREVWSDLATMGEVPFEDDRVDAAGILPAPNPVLVQGNDVDVHLVGAAQDALSVFIGEDPSQANSKHEVSRVRRGINRVAATNKDAAVPSGMAKHIDRAVGGNLSQQSKAGQETKQG